FDKIAQYLRVRYRYEELEPSDSTRGGSTQGNAGCRQLDSSFILQPSSFQIMPSTWVNELYQAANCIDNEELFRLIEQIPPAHAPLAKAIADLIDKFRYDLLVELIEAMDTLK
ncbi:MAG: hybrid sensor histidine kinase/response regulator, partial [Coleofasciculus sp. Co-bin14]|nr:hybrid sensor histidine kinase/response regulator [Coleofasciculus sp. Co-bin14]